MVQPENKPQIDPSGVKPPANKSGNEIPPGENAQKEQIAKNKAEKDLIDTQADLNSSRAKLEKSKTDLLTAQLGTFTTTNTGTNVDTGTDKTPYIAELVAQKALIENADAVAGKINTLKEKISKILIVDSLELCTDDVGLLQIKSQVSGYNQLFNERLLEIGKLLHEVELELSMKEMQRLWTEKLDLRAFSLPLGGVSAALTGVSSILTGVSNIVGFFQDQYSIRPSKPSPELVSLQARVAGKITKCPVVINKNYRIDSSPLLVDLQGSLILREKLSGKKERLGLASAQNPDPRQEAIDKPIRESAVKAAETLIKAFDAFFTLITTIPQGASYSPLMIAIMRDYLDKLDISHYLFLKVASVGGDVITVKSIWPWKSGQMSVIAGSIFTAILVDKTGRVVLADTITPDLKKLKFQFNKFSTNERE